MSALQGQRVLVTGSTQGIGLETARAFLEAGARVFVTGLTPEHVSTACRTLGIPEQDGAAADLRSPKAIQTLFSVVASRFGFLDVLINNAGVSLLERFEEGTFQKWEDLLQINVRAPFLCAREAVRLMRPRGRGFILTVSSNLAHNPIPGFAVYSASKSAVSVLTQALQGELIVHGIKTAVIAPGAVETDILQGVGKESAFSSRDDGIQRLRPEEVARAIVGMCMQAGQGSPRFLLLEHNYKSGWK